MGKVLVLFAHPNQSMSRVNVEMFKAAVALEGITTVDLYAHYPRYKIDVDAEQKRLLEHDFIVFQFPFYWYSTPALLKEWQDLVLEYGFAYGERGTRLAGKSLLVAATAGADKEAYRPEGKNHFSIRTLLSPVEQTAALCQMRYLSPLVLFSSLAAAADDRVTRHVEAYRRLLLAARDSRLDLEAAMSASLLDPTVLPIGVEH